MARRGLVRGAVSDDKRRMQDLASNARPAVTVVGAGPAGLIAALRLAEAGARVTIYDRMPSPARKLLMAGRGGLNLTHSEPLERFAARYGAAASRLQPLLEDFPPSALRAFADDLGETTFIGSSGRVFPKSMKASPLLRALLRRLDALGVRLVTRHEWIGFGEPGEDRFRTADGAVETVSSDATLLALGGASWPRLGSDGSFAPILEGAGVEVTPLAPANVGFAVAWTDIFRDRFAGTPLNNITVSHGGKSVRGEAMIARYGIEGGAIYALSGDLRTASPDGGAYILIDLSPQLAEAEIAARIERQRPSESLANRLRKAIRMAPVAINLMREARGELPRDPGALAALIKALPLRLGPPAGLERAISTAGGVAFGAVDDQLMLLARPGTFVAGEMLDWEAPTGGYLLQASFATGVRAAEGIKARLGLAAPAA